MRKLKQSTARTIYVLMVDSSDHITGKTGLTLTITAGKAGGAFASISPTVTERGNGWYAIALTASHTDTLGDLALHVTATGADPADFLAEVVAYDPNAVDLGITQFAHETGRTILGVVRRLDSLMVGKATGLLSSLATFYRADGTTVAIEAAQNTTAGTRDAASTVGGD